MPPPKIAGPPVITVSPADPEAQHEQEEESHENFRYDGDGLVDIQDEYNTLGDLLRYHEVDGEDGTFWTEKLLRHILTRERIETELRRSQGNFGTHQINEYIDKILAFEQGGSHVTFLKTFTLLTLIDRCGDIGNFIEEGFGDHQLPIGVKRKRAYRLRQPEQEIKCFDNWDGLAKDNFETFQWRVNTPYFQSTTGQPLEELRLWDKTRKPWRRSPIDKSETSVEMADTAGAYGVVIRVDIHPTSHSFQELLTGINLACTKFAIKTLYSMPANNEQTFRKEWEMLKRFSGLTHPHLVTVLGAFQQKDQWNFIFPNADHDLGYHLENKNPLEGQKGASWLSNQLMGLMGALNTIHNPDHLDQGAKMRYGRHGDIKCDNILCFKKSGTEKDTVLVISDFGLSALNSDKSRSNIPNRQVPPVPGYRPPECDIEGGTVSRAFDIWTLGCLFLELITWFLGGRQYIKQFDEARTTMFISGSKNNIFFKFKKKPQDGTCVVLVKPEVIDWILCLHKHPDCSDFVHSALDIIEKEMLVVLAKDRKRSSSGKLLGAFQGLASKCQSQQGYIRGNPWTGNKHKAAAARMRENNMAVEAVPSENAQAIMDNGQITLTIYEGQTRKSLRPEELRNMDSTN
ncbi:uncharacterized protein FRV6_16204 [Fusarium oxysporum]|uniref:Protein kinase domain-containing protein n=1 Tax=Fusarium oxysporum TaxID=5507 RepID=A0A2H3U9U2_FUSOX|nr:uncharacterized protein FRV6_16204 [Fusarium oxysporum]